MKLILVTCKPQDSEKIAEALLSEKLIACVNIIPEIKSKYWWKDKIETDTESLLFIKTKDELVEKVISKVKEIHPYEVPEIISFNIEQGNPDYLKWISDSCIAIS